MHLPSITRPRSGCLLFPAWAVVRGGRKSLGLICLKVPRILFARRSRFASPGRPGRPPIRNQPLVEPASWRPSDFSAGHSTLLVRGLNALDHRGSCRSPGSAASWATQSLCESKQLAASERPPAVPWTSNARLEVGAALYPANAPPQTGQRTPIYRRLGLGQFWAGGAKRPGRSRGLQRERTILKMKFKILFGRAQGPAWGTSGQQLLHSGLDAVIRSQEIGVNSAGLAVDSATLFEPAAYPAFPYGVDDVDGPGE